MILPLKGDHLSTNMAKKFGDIQPSLLLFLHRLRSISIEDQVDHNIICTSAVIDILFMLSYTATETNYINRMSIIMYISCAYTIDSSLKGISKVVFFVHHKETSIM